MQRESTDVADSPRSKEKGEKATMEGDVQDRRDSHDESRESYRKGETSESPNPKDGFGTKQGRDGMSGKNRHEVEKT